MRYGYLIILAAVLGLPFVLRSVAMRNEKSAQAEKGAASLVIVTPHNSDIRREFARAFDQWHREHYGQSVILDYRAPGGTTDMVRLINNVYDPWRNKADGSLPAQMPVDLDMVWGGGDYTFYHTLQPAGVLQPIQIDPALFRAAFPSDTLVGVRLFDTAKDKSGNPTPQWIGVCLSSFGIVYSPSLCAALDVKPPASWADLTNPKYFGFIALADPAHSGSASVAYMMVIQRAMADAEQNLFEANPAMAKLPRAQLKTNRVYQEAIADGWRRGMGQLLLIAANARYFTDSSEVVPTDVGRGEAAAGMAIDFYARVTVGVVGPERAAFVSPQAATAITPDAVAILHGVSGEKLTLATHFVEFLLSDEGQRLWILQPGHPGGPIERSLRRMPIRRDVYSNQAGWADHFDPFNEAGNFNQRGEWMALMSDTMPIWDAAWIDSRDALRDAYESILKVPDANRRAELFEKLSQLPITMRDVEMRRTQRMALEQSQGDVFAWQARDRLNWANRFRDHYRSVATEAAGK